MTEVRAISSPNDGGAPGEAEVLQTARSLAEDEFNRAERFDRKALNLATIVGAFFSLSQIVVVGALSTEDLVTGSWPGRLLVVGIAATAAAAAAVGAAVMVFRTRGETGGPLEMLKPWLAATRRHDARVTEQMVLTYEKIAESRRDTNGSRTFWYRIATWLAVVAVGATAAELVLVLLAIT